MAVPMTPELEKRMNDLAAKTGLAPERVLEEALIGYDAGRLVALDWSRCPAVEQVPGKVSGAWVLRGTRVPVATIFENLRSGGEHRRHLGVVRRPRSGTAGRSSTSPRGASTPRFPGADARPVRPGHACPAPPIPDPPLGPDHAEQQWSTLGNGELLDAAEAAGFQILLTTDKNIRYQQNLAKRRIAIIVLGRPEWPVLRLHLERVVSAVDAATPASYCEVQIPD